MIYFIAYSEGGPFIQVITQRDISPVKTVEFIKKNSKEKFVALFKNGSCFDSFLGDWRKNKIDGIISYNKLLKNKDMIKVGVRNG